ncbi:MAG TPA: T9SS type A sorting domain-containing protein [Candidatus Kryptonia bacterium]
MVRSIRFKLVLFFLLVAPGLLFGQWTETRGPEGSYVLCFAQMGSNVYAGTDGGGVYVSTNAGESWTQSNAGLKDLAITALAVNGARLFAAVQTTRGGSNVYVSTDEGTSWTPAIDNGLPNDSGVFFAIDCFAVAPNGTGGTNLYLGTAGYGIYVSNDNGANWTPDTVGLLNPYVHEILVNDTSLYAGTNAGVCGSTINGTSWKWLAPADIYYIDVASIVICDSSLFVSGSTAGVDGHGIFRSTDNGTSWTHVFAPAILGYIGPMAVTDTELFAGTTLGVVYHSADNGATWSESSLPGMNLSVQTMASVGTKLYAGTYGGGVFVSTDHGTSWTSMSVGMKNSKVNAVAVKDSNIYAGTMAVGIFRSTDGGNTWIQVNTGLTNYPGLAGLNVVGLAVNDSSLFAGVEPGGVFKSTDDGDSWSQVGIQVPGLFGTFALTAKDTILFAGTLGPGIFRSTDGGTTWNLSNTGLSNTGVSALVASDSNLFAGTYGGGVFRSTNDGDNWTGAGLTDHYVAALALNGTWLYARTYDAGLFVSTDFGANWTEFDSSSTSESIISLAADRSNLYAGSSVGVIYRPVSGITYVVPPPAHLPVEFRLLQNYPNPFNPSTVISYQLPAVSRVTLKVFDILGREIATLVDARENAGYHEVRFDGSRLSSGVYFYRMTAGNYVSTRKLLLIK